METTFEDAQLGKITIAKSHRAKRITIRVKLSGEVRLSFPPTVSDIYAWRFLNQRREWILKAQEQVARRRVVQRFENYTPEQIEHLRLMAKQQLPQRVEQLAKQFGFKYGRVTIRAARTKWGCCTSKNNLSLSLFLMTLPEHLRDFIILHELCHTIHLNHSPRFHSLLDSCLGGREKELERELKTHYE